MNKIIAFGIAFTLAASSAFAVASITLLISFLTLFGVMPCCLLYSSCFRLLRSVSSIAAFMALLMPSQYIMTLLSTFLAALPMVCMRDVSVRRKPSLSASSIATRETSGISSPSLRRLIPTSTSNSPSLRSLIISILSRVSISE